MKVNYVLMYGIPYVRYKEFETFEDISKFLVHKGFVNYSIFKKLEDKEEIEMIYRDNDIHYLENFVKEQDKEIERLTNQNKALNEMYELTKKEYIRLNKQIEEYQKALDETTSEKINLHSIINELEKYLKEYSNDLEFRCYANMFLDKLQELKGEDKE